VYPAIFIKAAKDDFRSPLWNVLKYAARFRHLAKKSSKVQDVLEKGLLIDIVEGGHFGGGGV
jgi:protease II